MSYSVIIDAAPKYAFLALPPPPLYKKKRSVTASDQVVQHPITVKPHPISTWAQSVLPGSPAPLTPAPLPSGNSRSPSNPVFRQPSVPARSRAVSRRRSVSSTRSRAQSISFLNFSDTPTTHSPFSADDGIPKFDLTSIGYTSAFVNFNADTPITPEIHKPKPLSAGTTPPPVAAPAKSPSMFKRFQSMTQLRGKAFPAKPKSGKSRPASVVSDTVSVSSKKRAIYSIESAAAVEKQKRSRYAAALQATVMQEAQLRQMMAGGSLDYNLKKVMEKKAKQQGATKVQTSEGIQVVEGVQDVWRDGEGGMWWDEDEEWEFAHLLGDKELVNATTTIEQWISFGDKTGGELTPSSAPSSPDSELHESYAITVDDSMEDLRIVAGRNVLASQRKAAVVLAIPSRSNRMAKHLRKPQFPNHSFPVPASPRPQYPTAVCGSRSLSETSRRRRAPPPPLQLVPPGPCMKLAVNHDDEKEFLANSFKPTARAAPICDPSSSRLLSVPASVPGMRKKSVVGLAGLFKKSDRT